MVDGVPSEAGEWLWWVVSVIFVSLVINLLSSFLYPLIEKYIARFSESRKKKIESRKDEFIEKVEDIKSNKLSFIDLKLEMIYGFQFYTFFCLIGTIAYPFLVDNYPLVAIIILLISTSFGLRTAAKIWNIGKLIKASKE